MIVRKQHFYMLFILLMLLTVGFAQAQDSSVCPEDSQVIPHAMGEACVPENPQRVVVLEWTYVEDLLALGVQPVGVADIEGYHNWVSIPAALDENVVDVGTRAEPNLELIAELNPDLIIGVQFRLTQNYDELSAIAPTLVFNPYPDDLSVSQYEEMTTTFTAIAEALNREEEAQAVLAQLQDTYARAQAALEAAGRGGERFIISQGWSADNAVTFRLFTDNAMAVQILEQLGLENAWDDAPQLYGYTEIGVEGFAELSDEIFNFFYVAQESDNNFFAESPLWSSLAFVQAERAYWLGGDAWLFGGPLSAEVVVETVLQAMGIELPAAEGVAVAEAARCAAGYHPIQTPSGPVICIPQNPERIVAITDSDLDALLALGVEPAGITNGRGQMSPARYLADVLPEDVTIVGDFFTPNLELVLELEPDVILAAGLENPDLLEQLNAIAPTVDTYLNGFDWQTHFRTVAEVLNRQAEAEAFIAAYDERIAALQETLADHLDDEFIVARWGADGPQVMAPVTFVSDVLFDLGLTSPPEIPELQSGHAHSAPLSLETLGVIDVDWAFIGTLQSEGDAVTALDAALENPLFQALEVVQNEQLIVIDGSLWTSSGGPLAVMMVLDDVEAAMTGGE